MGPCITVQSDDVLVQQPQPFAINGYANLSSVPQQCPAVKCCCSPQDTHLCGPKRQLSWSYCISLLWEMMGVSILWLLYGFGCCLVNMYVSPCSSALQELLSLIGIIVKCMRILYNKLCGILWGCLTPRVHTFSSNPVFYGQCCVQYQAKCPGLGWCHSA
jgi:hypothetical protein